MGLDRYKLDKAFTEGVDLRLDDAPDDVFRVRLPSKYNRPYSQGLYGGSAIPLDEKGELKGASGLIAWGHAQFDAFVQHCMISLNGEPIPADFHETHPAAVEELMEKAAEQAADLDEKVSLTVKKSSASSSGKASGQDGKSSISDLRSQAG